MARTQIVMRRVVVSPADAHRLLVTNTNNRRYDQRLAKQYAETMDRGEWMENGQTNLAVTGTFDKPGRLLNGQHTLHAVRFFDAPMPLWIAEHVPADAFVTIDGGKGRSFASDLETRGEKDANAKAAAIRLLLLYSKYDPRLRIRIQRTELEPFWESHKDIETSVQVARRVHSAIRGSISVYAVAHYITAKIDPYVAEQFFLHLQTGENLTAADPIYQLRKRIIDLAFAKKDGAKKGSQGFVEQDDYLGMIITAWNLHRDGKDARAGLRYVRQPDKPFPRPH